MGDRLYCKIDKREFSDWSHYRVVQSIRAHIRDKHRDLGLDVLSHSFANLASKGVSIYEVLDFPPPPPPPPLFVVLDTNTGSTSIPLCAHHAEIHRNRLVSLSPEIADRLKIISVEEAQRSEMLLVH